MPDVAQNPGLEHDWRRSALAVAVIFIAYSALACLTTWPVAANLATQLPGLSADEMVHYWNGWQVQDALANGRFPLYTPLLFYPRGVSLVTHNIAWFNVLPWLLLEPLTGGITAYNLALLLNLTLCGCTLFWLAHRLTGDARAAFVAGVIYLAWPFRVWQLDHPNLLAVEWLPVFFLFLILTIRDGRRRDAVLAGLFFALVGYTRWQQLIPAALMAAIYFITALPALWAPARRRIFTRLVLAGAVAVVLLAPPAALLASEQGEPGSADLLRGDEEVMMSTDLLAYLTPAETHPVLKQFTLPLYERYYSDRAATRRTVAYLGAVAAVLGIAGIAARKRESLPWLLMAVALILLALGPVLRVNGTFFEVPTLYGLLEPLGVFRIMREPDRFNMFLALPVAVLAAYGLAALLSATRLRTARTKSLAAGALGALVVCEYLVGPAAMRDVSAMSGFFTQLAGARDRSAVLNLPLDPMDSKFYMLAQTVHHRAILDGKVARMPARAYQYIDANPLLHALRANGEMQPALTDVSRQLAALARDDIGYIIMYKGLAPREQLLRWRRYLLITRTYADNDLAVFTTSPQAGRDFNLLQELAPGIGPIGVLTATDCLNPGHPLAVDVGWGTRTAQNQDLTAELALVDAQGVPRQTERFPVSDSWPTSQWPADAIAWGYYAFPVSPLLPAGPYSVTLQLLDPAGQPLGERMAVQAASVQPDTCHAGPDPEAIDADTRYGDEIQLDEYKLDRQPGDLTLTLAWRGLRHMQTDYHFFVHVYDPATGTIVAQADAIPGKGPPTSYWWPCDAIADTVVISLDGVPAGTYRIAVGIYDPATMQRLPAIDGQDRPIPDGRLVLDGTVQVR